MTNGIRELIRFFNKHNINYALIGGSALHYYNESRVTQDFDFVVTVDAYDISNLVDAINRDLCPTVCNPHHSILTIQLFGFNIDIIPYFTNEEQRALRNAKLRNYWHTRCRIARIEDILLLKLGISDSEERHLKDVEFVCRDCKEFIDTKYLKEGIIALNMQRYVPYLNNLLGSNIII